MQCTLPPGIVRRPWRGVGFGVSKAHEGFTALSTVPDELRGIIRDATQRNSEGVLPGFIRLDEAFTDAALRAALRQHYPVVHIASHFQLHPGDDTASFLLLGDGSHLPLAQLKTWPQPPFRGRAPDPLSLQYGRGQSGGRRARSRRLGSLGPTPGGQGGGGDPVAGGGCEHPRTDVESLNGVRKPLGKVMSRKLQSAQHTKSVPGAPDGNYVVMQFDTRFENKQTAIETVTFLQEKDGKWKAAGYYIK